MSPLVELDISQEKHRRLAKDFVLLWRKKPAPRAGKPELRAVQAGQPGGIQGRKEA